MSNADLITLYDLQHRIKQHLADGLYHPVWVVAEISDITVNRSGHCYLEWIQKDDSNDQIVARARATIWANQFRMLKPYFESVTGQVLSKGLKILWKGRVEYHEVFGLSIQVMDLDPAYTLGDMERRRREVVARLNSEGILDLNKELELPIVPQRLAVISSATAAGYEDFVNQLENNAPGFKIYHVLFPAVMQGQAAEASIIAALERIYSHEQVFDAVAIIRGGGSATDLLCFDGYELAAHVAQFPLPVLTGIGHERDDSVVDQVAHTRLKTPTAVAGFILDCFSMVWERIREGEERFLMLAQRLLATQANRMESLSNQVYPIVQQRMFDEERRLQKCHHLLELAAGKLMDKHARKLEWMQQVVVHAASADLHTKKYKLDSMEANLPGLLAHYWQRKEDYLRLMERTTFLMDPVRLLQRGFSLTYSNGKLLRHPSEVSKGDMLTTRFAEGEITSEAL